MYGETQIRIASRLYEVRQTVRRIMDPDVYQERMAQLGEQIRQHSRAEGKSEMAAVMDLVQGLQRDVPTDTALLQLQVLAAYVEMTEPTPMTPCEVC